MKLSETWLSLPALPRSEQLAACTARQASLRTAIKMSSFPRNSTRTAWPQQSVPGHKRAVHTERGNQGRPVLDPRESSFDRSTQAGPLPPQRGPASLEVRGPQRPHSLQLPGTCAQHICCSLNGPDICSCEDPDRSTAQ